jgi:FKBP12-rapamycin complex-associated protein
LVDFDGEENATKITRFANYLRIVLPGSDPQVMALSAKALGRLALVGGTLTVDFVEFEVKRALEWLQGDRIETRRQAAVLVLKELVENAPTILYAYVSNIIDLIWIPLRDPKVTIREIACETLAACLVIIAQRDNSIRITWYQKLIEEIFKGFKGSLDYIHGSLLALAEMLLHTRHVQVNAYSSLLMMDIERFVR